MTVSSNPLAPLRSHYACRVTSLAGKTIKVVMLNLVTIVTSFHHPDASISKAHKGPRQVRGKLNWSATGRVDDPM